ncbi:cation dependent mannose-6-phosphate cargo receptor [Rhizophagus clarus]|uniref:Autophagy-related protein 27 n=1 Tax=Rhizophagus clarus TaxID=94130 RepID=A0A8H3M2X1_9GLOM|nr:cation dependent mannose-6-phosphate cargo receptor [Rhizophagus clarus]
MIACSHSIISNGSLVQFYLTDLCLSRIQDSQLCTVTNETTNKYYDLSPLKKTEGEDWIVYGYGTGWTFRMNICRNVLYRNDNDDYSNFEEIGVYGINPEYYDNGGYKDHSLGKISEKPLIRGDKLVMEFSDGKNCAGTNYKSTSVVSFICDKTVEGQGQPIFISGFRDCAFFFEWRTPAACPTDKKDASKGGWGVFFTIFIIALIVYFVGGIIYNRMVHNATGMYQIPNWEFWSNACDFLKDMILIIMAQCPVFKPRRHGGRNYRNLPRDEENILIGEEFEEH